MKNKVYICYTYYHLYVSLLENLNNKTIGKNYLILTDHMNESKNLIEKIQKYNIFKKIFYVKDFELKKKVLSNPLNCLFYKFVLKKIFEKENKELSLLKNNLEINIFLDSTTTSHYFMYKYSDINLIEDGTMIYYPRKMVLKDYIYFLLGIPKRVGRDKRIKNIYVQTPEKLPKDILKKGKLLNLKEIETKMSFNDKNILFDIFSFNTSYLDNITGKRCLILTQPLSEMNLVTENEKIQIYQDIINDYKNYDIFIKKHPRDKTNYPFDCIYLNKNFPIELIKFLPNRTFSKIIAIESSAIFNLNEVSETINLGYQINKKLYKNMMKDKKL